MNDNNITNDDNTNSSKEIQIPKANTNISEKEEKIISDYLQGVWITSDGEKTLAIDYGKRFCYIDETGKQYGTYTVKDGTSSSEPKIILTYTSGKKEELNLTQGETNYLVSNNKKDKYIEDEGYYFGISEGDEGVFDSKNKSVPKANTNISEKEGKIISNYFQGVWITSGGEKTLAIDYGKRFCCIDETGKQYGTYTVKDGTSSSEPKIILTYTSGKKEELNLTQGGVSYLVSNNKKDNYIEDEGYYFGTSEGDEGIFNK